MESRIVWTLFALAGLAASGYSQWVTYPTAGIPRTKDGKPNLSARAPRASNGKPDLSGVWIVEATPVEELTRLFGDMTKLSVPGDDPRTFSKYFLNLLADFKPQDAPMRPETAQIFLQRIRASDKDAPSSRCLPTGLPQMELVPAPFKIISTSGMIGMVYEGDGILRQIYTDGRKLPSDPAPLWYGYSIGKWEGDTFVVDSIGFNDKSWLDAGGHPHSEALHLTERFRRRDFGHLEEAITVDDPKMYTRPFTVNVTHVLQPDSDILEAFCTENEKDWTHMAAEAAK